MKIVDINGNERDCVKISQDAEWPGYLKAELLGKSGTHIEWFPIDEFVKNNPKLKTLTENTADVIEEVVGVVSSSTENALTDKNQEWKKNAYCDFPLWISRGKGEGQVRTVIGNTKNVLVVDKNWDTLPDKTSQYVLSHNIHNPRSHDNFLPAGFTDGVKIKQ